MNIQYIANPRKRLTLILIITSIHSFCVGIGLIVQLPILMEWFGFGHIAQPFFPAQGGIFHVLMSVAYCLAALKPDNNDDLIKFIICVKIAATIFLFTYFIFIDNIWMILLSGMSDGILAILILTAYYSYKKSKKNNG